MSGTLPDVRTLHDEPLPDAAFPGWGPKEFRVYLDPEVHGGIRAHCDADRSVEVCGVLVGRWERDRHGPYVHVDASLRGTAATSRGSEVTFTHETWTEINRHMDTEFADRSIVGWYHSHPDFGIFLSERDRFIHEHFFAAPGQIAMVVDPVRDEEGVFVWRDGRPELAPLHWVGDAPTAAPRRSAPRPTERALGRGPEDATEESRQNAAAAATSSTRARSDLTLILGVLAAFGLLLAGYMIAGARDRAHRAVLAEQVARQLVNRTSSLYATTAITRAAHRLAVLTARLQSEAAPGDRDPSVTDDPSDTPDRDDARARRTLLRELAAADRELAEALRMLQLSPEERVALDLLVLHRLEAQQVERKEQGANE